MPLLALVGIRVWLGAGEPVEGEPLGAPVGGVLLGGVGGLWPADAEVLGALGGVVAGLTTAALVVGAALAAAGALAPAPLVVSAGTPLLLLLLLGPPWSVGRARGPPDEALGLALGTTDGDLVLSEAVGAALLDVGVTLLVGFTAADAVPLPALVLALWLAAAELVVGGGETGLVLAPEAGDRAGLEGVVAGALLTAGPVLAAVVVAVPASSLSVCLAEAAPALAETRWMASGRGPPPSAAAGGTALVFLVFLVSSVRPRASAVAGAASRLGFGSDVRAGWAVGGLAVAERATGCHSGFRQMTRATTTASALDSHPWTSEARRWGVCRGIAIGCWVGCCRLTLSSWCCRSVPFAMVARVARIARTSARCALSGRCYRWAPRTRRLLADIAGRLGWV